MFESEKFLQQKAQECRLAALETENADERSRWLRMAFVFASAANDRDGRPSQFDSAATPT